MPRLTATRTFFLSGIGTVVPGQSFEAGRHAKFLVTLGRAVAASATVPQAARRRDPEYRVRRRNFDGITAEAPPLPLDPPEPAPLAEGGSASTATAEATVVTDHGESIIAALRERARALGVDVDGRWGADRLREEIETAARGRYRRRDLRPEE